MTMEAEMMQTYRAVRNAMFRQWYAAQKEAGDPEGKLQKLKDRGAAFYEANREACIQRQRDYYARLREDPEKFEAYLAKQRERSRERRKKLAAAAEAEAALRESKDDRPDIQSESMNPDP